MFKIEYEIKLNENYRPCIDLHRDYENKPEDRFFSIELARYILQDVYARKTPELDADTIEKLKISITVLGQIGDEIAKLLWESMKLMGETSSILNKNYHVMVNSIEERDNLGIYILYNEKIFSREIGLKVFVANENKVYILTEGIGEIWEEVI
jgi:hypothetical protein